MSQKVFIRKYYLFFIKLLIYQVGGVAIREASLLLEPRYSAKLTPAFGSFVSVKNVCKI